MRTCTTSRTRRRAKRRTRPRLLPAAARLSALTLLVTAGLLSGCHLGQPTDSSRGSRGSHDDAVAPRERGDWRLVWADEFRGPSYRGPDPAKWNFDRGAEPQWGNHEWQYYTDRHENVALDGDGHLVISARRERLPWMHCTVGPCDITSGRITTKGKFSQAYGRFEARIKVPKGKGMWPAFWMLGANVDRVAWPGNGEIDVMEVLGHQPCTVHGAVHGPGYVAKGLEQHMSLRGGSLSDGFHTYRVDWSPGKVMWLLDGKTYGTARSGQLRRGQRWVFDHPHYLLLNLAVGGDWPGAPDGGTPFPNQMVVDYVRVYAPGR